MKYVTYLHKLLKWLNINFTGWKKDKYLWISWQNGLVLFPFKGFCRWLKKNGTSYTKCFHTFNEGKVPLSYTTKHIRLNWRQRKTQKELSHYCQGCRLTDSEDPVFRHVTMLQAIITTILTVLISGIGTILQNLQIT